MEVNLQDLIMGLKISSIGIELGEEIIKKRVFLKNRISIQNFDRNLSMKSFVKIKEINPIYS